MNKNYFNSSEEEACEEKAHNERLADEKIRESSVAEIKTKKGNIWQIYKLLQVMVQTKPFTLHSRFSGPMTFVLL